MSKKCKWISLGLALAMLVGCLAGCGNQNNVPTKESTEKSKVEETKQEESSAIDTSKRVDLVCYFIGDEPKDMDKVSEKINEILLEKINATITFNFSTWTDYTNKYTMVLAGGEDCDIIYTATWIKFYELVEDEAFLELSGLIDTYAPDFKAMVDESYFDMVTLDGEIYCMPNTYDEYNNGGLMYREDLRKKYNLPIPNSIENLEAYMQGIKENEPTQTEIIADPSSVFQMNSTSVSALMPLGLMVDYNNPGEVLTTFDREEEILEELKTLKRWADAGYWSKSAIANSSSNKTGDFEAGKIVVYGNSVGPSKYITSKSAIASSNPDWEVGYIPYPEINGIAYANTPLGNGTAIPVNSKNPERAMMAINLLFTDKELNHLILYGIEGEHYNIDENGYYVAIEGSGYGYEASDAWNFRNKEYMLKQESNKELDDIFARCDAVAAKTNTPGVNIYAGFRGTISNTAAKSAFDAVTTEYMTPLRFGMVDDVEAGFKKYLEEAKKVGLEDLQKEYIKLWKEYIESKGY